MRNFILNNDSYMELLKRLDQNTFIKVMQVLPGSQYEKVEVARRVKDYRKGRIIVHIPHSSLKITDDFIKRLNVTKEYFDRINIFESDYLIDYFKPDNLSTIIFPYSRLLCDVERFRNDEDEVMARLYNRGVVYELDSNNKECINIDSDYKEFVLKEYYDKHHGLFEEMVKDKLHRYDECLIIDLHSFSNDYVNKIGVDKKGCYPDICIGYNSYRQIEPSADQIKSLCCKYEYTYMFNYPYSGSIVPLNYLNNDNVISIMIEVNKRIYLNESLDELDNNKTRKLHKFFDEFYKMF